MVLPQAGEHAKPGVRETIEPTETKLRELSGQEKEPEPSRLELLLADLKDAECRAEGEARTESADTRDQLESYRSKQ